MSFMRGLGRWLLSILMGVAFGTWLVSATLQMTVLNRTVVKGWVQNSGVYDKAIDSIPFEVNSGSDLAPKSFITTDDIKAALKKTFPASYLQTHVEAVLDASYDWLEGKSDKITFSIPVNEKMTDFITHLAEQIQPRLATLPACGGMIPPSDQPTCIPRGLNIAQFAAQLSDITNNGGDNFLSKPITQDSIGNTDTHLEWLPSAVQQLDWLTWSMPVLGVLCGAGYVLLSDSRLHGLKVVGRRVFFQGVVAVIFGGIIWYFGQNVSLASIIPSVDGGPGGTIEKSIVQNLVEPLLRNVLPNFGEVITILSAILAVVGATVWVTAIMLQRHGEKAKNHFLHTENTPNPLLHPETEEPKPVEPEKPAEVQKIEPPKPPKPPRPLVM